MKPTSERRPVANSVSLLGDISRVNNGGTRWLAHRHTTGVRTSSRLIDGHLIMAVCGGDCSHVTEYSGVGTVGAKKPTFSFLKVLFCFFL